MNEKNGQVNKQTNKQIKQSLHKKKQPNNVFS